MAAATNSGPVSDLTKAGTLRRIKGPSGHRTRPPNPDCQALTGELVQHKDLDVRLKTTLLKQRCEDINRVQFDVTYVLVFVDDANLNSDSPKFFSDLVANFRRY